MAYLVGTATNFEHLHRVIVDFLSGNATALLTGYSGVGNGSITELTTYPGTTSELWSIQYDGSRFSVTGSVSGPSGYAEIGKFYNNGKLGLLINQGSVGFSAEDIFTVTTATGTMPEEERWDVLRFTGVTRIQASSFLTGNEPFLCFKGPYHNHSGGWATAQGQHNNSWISWKMVNPLGITRLGITGSPTNNQSPRNFSLDYSADGVNWTTAQSWSDVSWANSEYKEFTVSGTTPQLFWRIFVSSNNGNTSTTRIDRISLPQFSQVADFNHARRPASWLRAPGMTGQGPCFINFQLYDRPTSDYYNMAVTGATGFVESSDFDNQPGALTAMGFPLWNGPIPFWIAGNGQRVVISVRVDTVYLSCYAGKMLTFGTPQQFPYPLLIGAPLSSASGTRYSDSSISLPYKGDRNNFKLRTVNGSWINPSAWPYSISVDFRDTKEFYPLLPITLYDGSNTYGTLDGVSFITGFNNAPENEVIVNDERYIVLQDWSRNGMKDFFAMRIE